MKWKRTLTAEEIALIVMGLEHADSIVQALRPSFEDHRRFNYSDATEANAICEALLEEIILVDPHYSDYIDERVLANTHLVVALRAITCDEGHMNPYRTTVTRESAAQWFLSMGDIEKAKRLMPSIENGSISLSGQQPPKLITEPRTPEPSLLDSIGIMAYMLSITSTRYSRSDKPNKSQIAKGVRAMAEELGIEPEGLSNLERDISKALTGLMPRMRKDSK
jgi:hypothetical protein